jgi:hypothetical protein
LNSSCCTRSQVMLNDGRRRYCFSAKITSMLLYAVLTQIFVCDMEFGDFCVCTFPNGLDSSPSIHIECILTNYQVWEECVEQETVCFSRNAYCLRLLQGFVHCKALSVYLRHKPCMTIHTVLFNLTMYI